MGKEEKEGGCGAFCRGNLCLAILFVAVAAGVAVSVATVFLSESLRERFPPDLAWWQTGVVYQVYPRSFQDSNGDGVGDLPGITSRLDYLQWLGLGTVWLSPFYPSPMKDFGYDISDYKDVDPVFGNLTNFDDLLKGAHDRGLRVIVDFVPGHTSDQHPWFLQSENGTAAFRDYYIWANATTLPNGSRGPPNNWVSFFGYSAWTWSNKRQQYFYHAFLPEQPTLNYRNTKVVQEIKDVVRFWLERGVDGFRVDAVKHMMVDADLSKDQVPANVPGTEEWQFEYWNNSLVTNQPEIGDVVRGWRAVMDEFDTADDNDDEKDTYKFMITEAYDPPAVRNRFFDYGADMPFNFDLVEALRAKAGPCDAICIKEAIDKVYTNLPDGKWANFVLSNHDNSRMATRVGAEYADALNLLLLTLRGTPTTYYGEEVAMQDIAVSYQDTQDPFGKNFGPARYQEVSRDPERAPMQWDTNRNAGFSNASSTWLPVHPDYKTHNVKVQRESSDTTPVQVYRDLANLRQEPALRYGLLTWVKATANVLAYVRHAEDFPRYLVALNLGKTEETVDLAGDPVSASQGHVKVATSGAARAGRLAKGKDVALSGLTLQPGDGVLVELSR